MVHGGQEIHDIYRRSHQLGSGNRQLGNLQAEQKVFHNKLPERVSKFNFEPQSSDVQCAPCLPHMKQNVRKLVPGFQTSQANISQKSISTWELPPPGPAALSLAASLQGTGPSIPKKNNSHQTKSSAKQSDTKTTNPRRRARSACPYDILVRFD